MRSALVAACTIVVLTAAPVAQETTPALSAEADKAMWCGAAFGVMRETLNATGDTDGATAYDGKAAAAFAAAARELIAGGMSVEAFSTLAESYAVKVLAPFREVSFSEADCEAVAAE